MAGTSGQNANLTNNHHNLREIMNCRYHGTVYENHEYNVTTASTNDSLQAQTGAFDTVHVATLVSIRTNETITIKFNDTGNDGVTVTSTDSPFEIDYLEVTNVYISNASGNTAAIKILLS
jgi:hypothetical protein